MTTADVAVLLFGDRRVPQSLRGLATVTLDDITRCQRVLVVGADADLAAVLTRLLRIDRLDIEVAHVSGRRGARRAVSGIAQRVPLIRDDTGQVIVGSAQWRAADGLLRGEAVVDDTVLFDGEVSGVQIEPTHAMPGLRAKVSGPAFRGQRWVAGRAAQLGTPGAVVVRDGVPAARPVKRSTFYRHTEGWLSVR